LLLDEPFGALDAKVRVELRQWLRELHDQTHLTSVFVTHDQEEAFAVADQVVVMNQGRVEQVGTPQEIFEHPANPFVMDFLGNVNVFPGRVQNGRALLGGLDVEYPDHPHDHALPATGYVRPHELDLHDSPNGAPSVAGVVVRIQRTGPVVRVLVESAEFGVSLNVELSNERFGELKLSTGDRVYVSPRRVRVFVPEYAI
jgi:sulfate transport system ATP-binding protein